ncbi:MAG: hypothetical protein HYY20_06430 [Candidatus Tectomicrobia bacterium]|uniref:Uncharacterized protein n=1 Tax=Tectimicrobiota bacterium TaxID=2528274 RepID=A0A932CN76_UNCTE|nr:hypothetical protein [Candidatus Tectomicrobia bacterium]
MKHDDHGSHAAVAEVVEEVGTKDPLGLETENIVQDLASGAQYIQKGGWVFLLLLAIILFITLRNLAQVFDTSLTEVLINVLKELLS